jgi:hypothetical protein
VPVFLSFLRHSCHLTPWSFIPLVHSSLFHHLFSTVGPLWQRPLCRAGMARHVIHLQATANFFRDPPSPWVHFFSCQRCPTARCWSPYQSSSALIVATAASSLGTSWWSATDYISSGIASHSSNRPLLDRLPLWPSPHDGLLFFPLLTPAVTWFSVTIHRFWIYDQIYWTPWYSTWLHFTVHYYTHTQSCLHCHCLVSSAPDILNVHPLGVPCTTSSLVHLFCGFWYPPAGCWSSDQSSSAPMASTEAGRLGTYDALLQHLILWPLFLPGQS